MGWPVAPGRKLLTDSIIHSCLVIIGLALGSIKHRGQWIMSVCLETKSMHVPELTVWHFAPSALFNCLRNFPRCFHKKRQGILLSASQTRHRISHSTDRSILLYLFVCFTALCPGICLAHQLGNHTWILLTHATKHRASKALDLNLGDSCSSVVILAPHQNIHNTASSSLTECELYLNSLIWNTVKWITYSRRYLVSWVYISHASHFFSIRAEGAAANDLLARGSSALFNVQHQPVNNQNEL